MWPNEVVTASHEVLWEIREFDGLSTAALNGYLQPVVAPTRLDLDTALATAKFSGRAAHHAVEWWHHVDCHRTEISGAHGAVRPRGGRCSACVVLARAVGFNSLITCDLGGTSFDVAVIAGGKVAIAPQATVDFGLAIRTPMIEITTIGAGGRSIALVDRGGWPQVGLDSVGVGAGSCPSRRGQHAGRR